MRCYAEKPRFAYWYCGCFRCRCWRCREAQQLIDEHTAAAALALDTGNAKGRKRGGRRANRSNGANGSAANSRNASNTDLVGMADAAAAAEDEATAATGPAAVDVEAGAVSLGRTDTQQQQQEDEAELSHRRQREQEEEEAGAALSRFAQPTWVQLRLLLGRALVSQLRNRNYNFARIVISVCVALALGSLFWDKGRQRCGQGLGQTHPRPDSCAYHRVRVRDPDDRGAVRCGER